jgi:hypothetical protein
MGGRQLIIVVAALAAAACVEVGPAEPDIGFEAQAYLNQALDVMEHNSVHRLEIDWSTFRLAAVQDAGAVGANAIVDIHPVIDQALVRLGDGHSFFRSVDGTEADPSSSTVFGGQPSTEQPGEVGQASRTQPRRVTRLDDRVAHMRVDAFASGGVRGDALVDTYHNAMRDLETSGTCGWVVDVRGNEGGNMWPMLAAVGPLLGPGPVGYFLYPDGTLAPWIYESGGAGLDEGAIAATADPWIIQGRPAVALLTDAGTASAGEAVVVAFRGHERARSFGAATWGVSTGNAAFPLSDGSVIFLTVATMVDRDGIVHGGQLTPDVVVGGEPTGDPATDPALAAAIAWIHERPCS